MSRSCETCEFWDIAQRDRDDMARCRRNPPSIGEQGAGAWPVTSNDDWCGHHVLDLGRGRYQPTVPTAAFEPRPGRDKPAPNEAVVTRTKKGRG